MVLLVSYWNLIAVLKRILPIFAQSVKRTSELGAGSGVPRKGEHRGILYGCSPENIHIPLDHIDPMVRLLEPKVVVLKALATRYPDELIVSRLPQNGPIYLNPRYVLNSVAEKSGKSISVG